MCFGSKLKGEDPSSRLNNDYEPNSRSIDPKHTEQQASSIKMPNEYSPPSVPPPSRGEYATPSGPPRHDDYAPPPGPPPNNHDWQIAVPDTSLLPPPPSMGNQQSRTNNATEREAEQGEIWCRQNLLTGSITYPEAALEAIAQGNIGVVKPRSYQGTLERTRPGVWAGKTKSTSPDSCILSTVPLYSVMAHSPLRTGRAKTCYYEIRISKRNRSEVSLAMGFAAPPYPTFRLPGWHRGCLAVHGDDGSKYINDRWGGKDFTSPFEPGETLGLGMRLTKRDLAAPPAYDDTRPQTEARTPLDVEIFLTRNGSLAGSWNLHEEGDAVEDLTVEGLEGYNDLFAAVGTFEGVDFEIAFNEAEWTYHP